MNCSPSVGVAVAMVGLNCGGAGGERNGGDVLHKFSLKYQLKLQIKYTGY